MTESDLEVQSKASAEADWGEIIGLNKVVAFDYRLCEVDSTGNRGEWFEKSKNREPLYYLHGFHNVIIGLERALEGKKVGDKIEITLQPEEAYGSRDPEGIRRIPTKNLQLPEGVKTLKAGGIARVRSNKGWHNAIILKPGKFNADLDFNHPLAGRVLHYEIEVQIVREATNEELELGYADREMRERPAP
ncbi:MAG: FKBP-type peptidyl-prolyl cis-trans isomerase [Gammaproteobacteria bacterium]|nr:FKBP-type peptidyl-prolyl cis-trans isomerase [Gammaproteobacteria bacterium]